METYRVPTSGPVDCRIRPPGSKSITNRALICAALAEGPSRLTGALESEDTLVLLEALRKLGLAVEHRPAEQTIDVAGCGGQIPARAADLYIANSGTSVRFLTAMLAAGKGRYRLDGTPRMRERPIGDLLDGLAQLGVRATSEAHTGCPPVLVEATGLAGGAVRLRGDVSSQFLSGLLLAAPYARTNVEIEIDGPLVSQPYVTMTIEVMRAFGATVRAEGFRKFTVDAPRRYCGRHYAIEPDASAASYFFAAAAITGGRATVLGLSPRSLQGDVAFVDVLKRMGCHVERGDDWLTVVGRPLRGIDVDMNAISDTVQTVGAVAVFAEGPTRVTGVGHIRHKETDRIAALATELRKLGAEVDEQADGLAITPRPLHGAEIDTYHDHRMAMSLALVGLRVPDVVIRDPGCTSKTYPRFFADLESILRPIAA